MINISKEGEEDYEVLFKKGFYKISFKEEDIDYNDYNGIADTSDTTDVKEDTMIYLKEDTWSGDLDTLLLKEFPERLGYISFKRIDYLLDYRDKEKIKENK